MERGSLVSATNSLRMLSLFDDAHPELGISELSRTLGLAKSTVHRMADTFVHEAVLERNERTGKYCLGSVLLELGLIVQECDPVVLHARGPVEELHCRTGAQASFHVRLDETALCVCTSAGPGFAVGQRAPLDDSITGLTLLAFSDDESMGSGHDETDISVSAYVPQGCHVRDELDHITERGYGTGVNDQGHVVVVCPVFDESGRTVGVVAVTDVSVDGEVNTDLVTQAGRAAQQLSMRRAPRLV